MHVPVRDEIRGWLREQLEDVTEEGALSLVALVHHAGQGGETELYAVKSGSTKWGNADLMADVILSIAQRHARGLPGQQQFQLHAMFGNAPSNTPKRFLPFGLAGALSFGAVPGGLATEAPTPVGLTQQSMRHTEIILQGAFAKDKHATDTLLHINRDLQAQLGISQGEIRELWVALKEVFTRMIEIEHRAQLDVITAKRNAVIVQEGTRLLPALLNGVTGRNIFPVAAGDTALLRGVLNFADDKTLSGLSAIAEQQGPEAHAAFTLLVNRLTQLRKEETEHEKKIEDLAGEQVGLDYAAAAKNAAGAVVDALKKTIEVRQVNGGNGHTGEATAPLGTSQPKQLTEAQEAERESKPAEGRAESPSLADAFGRMFIGEAAESDVKTLAGIMRAQGKAALADAMIAAFAEKKGGP